MAQNELKEWQKTITKDQLLKCVELVKEKLKKNSNLLFGKTNDQILQVVANQSVTSCLREAQSNEDFVSRIKEISGKLMSDSVARESVQRAVEWIRQQQANATGMVALDKAIKEKSETLRPYLHLYKKMHEGLKKKMLELDRLISDPQQYGKLAEHKRSKESFEQKYNNFSIVVNLLQNGEYDKRRSQEILDSLVKFENTVRTHMERAQQQQQQQQQQQLIASASGAASVASTLQVKVEPERAAIKMEQERVNNNVEQERANVKPDSVPGLQTAASGLAQPVALQLPSLKLQERLALLDRETVLRAKVTNTFKSAAHSNPLLSKQNTMDSFFSEESEKQPCGNRKRSAESIELIASLPSLIRGAKRSKIGEEKTPPDGIIRTVLEPVGEGTAQQLENITNIQCKQHFYEYKQDDFGDRALRLYSQGSHIIGKEFHANHEFDIYIEKESAEFHHRKSTATQQESIDKKSNVAASTGTPLVPAVEGISAKILTNYYKDRVATTTQLQKEIMSQIALLTEQNLQSHAHQVECIPLLHVYQSVKLDEVVVECELQLNHPSNSSLVLAQVPRLQMFVSLKEGVMVPQRITFCTTNAEKKTMNPIFCEAKRQFDAVLQPHHSITFVVHHWIASVLRSINHQFQQQGCSSPLQP